MQKVLKIWSLLVCLSVLVAFKITKIDISYIITCDSGPYWSNFITCIRIYNAKGKKSWSREILIQKAPLPFVHSHSVSYGWFKRRLVDFLSIDEYWSFSSCSRSNLLAVSLPSPAFSSPNQNRHATQATRWHTRLTEIWHFSRETSRSIYKSTREKVDSRN